MIGDVELVRYSMFTLSIPAVFHSGGNFCEDPFRISSFAQTIKQGTEFYGNWVTWKFYHQFKTAFSSYPFINTVALQ